MVPIENSVEGLGERHGRRAGLRDRRTVDPARSDPARAVAPARPSGHADRRDQRGLLDAARDGAMPALAARAPAERDDRSPRTRRPRPPDESRTRRASRGRDRSESRRTTLRLGRDRAGCHGSPGGRDAIRRRRPGAGAAVRTGQDVARSCSSPTTVPARCSRSSRSSRSATSTSRSSSRGRRSVSSVSTASSSTSRATSTIPRSCRRRSVRSRSNVAKLKSFGSYPRASGGWTPNGWRAEREPRTLEPARSNAVLDLRLLREEPERVRAALARRGADRSAGRRPRRRRAAAARSSTKTETTASTTRTSSPSRWHGASPRSAKRARESQGAEGGDRSPRAASCAMPTSSSRCSRRACRTFRTTPFRTVTVRRRQRRASDVGARSETIPAAEDHLDIGTRLGVIDTERAARASGIALRLPRRRDRPP